MKYIEKTTNLEDEAPAPWCGETPAMDELLRPRRAPATG